MSKGLTDNQNYINIANAIRKKSGSSTAYKPAGMADAILGIETDSLDLEALDAMSELEDVLCELAADTEGDFEIQKPYLRAYGYLQCIAECTEDDAQPLELYEWIYKRLNLNDCVDSYTVTVDGQEKNVKAVETIDGDDYLVINLEQFSGIQYDNYLDQTHEGNDTFFHIYFRVIYDNPELFGMLKYIASFAGAMADGTPAGAMTAFKVRFVPEEDKADMIQAAMVAADEINLTIYDKFGRFIEFGEARTEVEKQIVSKVTHDWLLENNNAVVPDELGLIDQTMYPALSKGKVDPICASYALAYQYVLRRFGVESLIMTGQAYNGSEMGAHAWNLVSLTEPDGAYSEKAIKWTLVDVTYDDPSGMQSNFGSWTYFQIPWSALPTSAEEYGYHTIDHRAYPYPTEVPAYSAPYSGSTLYEWDTDMADEMGSYDKNSQGVL